MTKRLSEEAFAQAVSRITLTKQNTQIARQHLVKGTPQVTLATKYGVTQQTVSKTVGRVWQAYLDAQELPDNMQRITVVLPDDKAQIALAWEREAQKQRHGS